MCIMDVLLWLLQVSYYICYGHPTVCAMEALLCVFRTSYYVFYGCPTAPTTSVPSVPENSVAISASQSDGGKGPQGRKFGEGNFASQSLQAVGAGGLGRKGGADERQEGGEDEHRSGPGEASHHPSSPQVHTPVYRHQPGAECWGPLQDPGPSLSRPRAGCVRCRMYRNQKLWLLLPQGIAPSHPPPPQPRCPRGWRRSAPPETHTLTPQHPSLAPKADGRCLVSPKGAHGPRAAPGLDAQTRLCPRAATGVSPSPSPASPFPPPLSRSRCQTHFTLWQLLAFYYFNWGWAPASLRAPGSYERAFNKTPKRLQAPGAP